jgi:hypothetical protein
MRCVVGNNKKTKPKKEGWAACTTSYGQHEWGCDFPVKSLQKHPPTI